MDKLKQVQKYQFWILLFVALVLPLVGWVMARGGFIADVESRGKAIKDLNGQLNTSPADPNQDWKKGIDLINAEQSGQKLLAWRALWERQLPLMTWPAKMPADPDKIQPSHQEYWRTAYRKLLSEVRLKANPQDDDNPNGLIVYPEELLPSPDSEWVSQAPSIAQIVASQEDLWLLESLLTSIASVNEGAATIFDAPIREIQQLYLRGGSVKGAGGGGATKSSSGGGSSIPGMGAGAKDMMAAMQSISQGIAAQKSGSGMGGPMMGGGGGGGTTITPAKINADEDLGPERAAPAPKGAAGDKSAGSASKSSAAGPAMGAMMGGAMGGGSGASSGNGWSGSDKSRYRDDKDDLAWKTRGFHLEVIMHHRHVPDLLTALSNGSWPVTILRVQMSDYKDEDLVEVGSGSSGNRGSMASMMPGTGGAGRGGMGPGMSMKMMKSMSSGSMSGPGGKTPGGTRPPVTTRGEDDEGGMTESAGNQSVLDDPDLAHVAIVGLIYIMKKPPEEKAQPGQNAPKGPSPGQPAAAGTATAVAPNGNPVGGNAGPGNGSQPPAEETPATTEGDAAEASAPGDEMPAEESATESAAEPTGEGTPPAEPESDKPASAPESEQK